MQINPKDVANQICQSAKASLNFNIIRSIKYISKNVFICKEKFLYTQFFAVLHRVHYIFPHLSKVQASLKEQR